MFVVLLFLLLFVLLFCLVYATYSTLYTLSSFTVCAFSSGAKKVYIVGDSHYKQHWRKSRVYAGCLHRSIQFTGYNTTMRLEGIPFYVDFFSVSHARQLVVSVAGYSNLMGKLVEYRGGRLVGRSFSVNWRGPSDYKDNDISKKELNSSESRRLSRTQD